MRNKLNIDPGVLIKEVQLQKYIESKFIILIIIGQHKLNNYNKKLKYLMHKIRKKMKS